jgi:hypothetical protein
MEVTFFGGPLDRGGDAAPNSGERPDASPPKYVFVRGESSPPARLRPPRQVRTRIETAVTARFELDPRGDVGPTSGPFTAPRDTRGWLVGLTFTVGGARGTFEGRSATAIAEALDHAFGAEGEWEGVPPLRFGELGDARWGGLQQRAVADLGAENVPNLLALGGGGRGVYVPAPVQAMSLPMEDGGPLRCASLPGLRTELEELAKLWSLPLDEAGLQALVHDHPDGDEGGVPDAPEVIAFARLALAANEAARRDCPLWVVGPGG